MSAASAMQAQAINNRGQVVGSVGTSPENLQPHAVLLVPAANDGGAGG